jgi:hypothetical protein
MGYDPAFVGIRFAGSLPTVSVQMTGQPRGPVMPTNNVSLLQNANRVTSTFALYFSLDDEHRHADAPGLLSLITDLSLVEAAKEILPIVGHHLVERATDFVLDHALAGATALKLKLLSALRGNKASRNPDIAPLPQASDETSRLVELMTKALECSPDAEVARALTAGEIAIRTLVRTEFRAPEAKAGEYSVAITREIEMTLKKR